ncbi:hypothetical protein SPBRAN_1249 [uncultured Candidatus Thioglobus sp.]|nr:hypothetical protein SPBRAN_1249 [uncultured Candidatus Thioglobus sp.]
MANRDANFDVSPRIITILGAELIHDKKIAIAELVKNAYDADASLVKITIGNDEIIIEDDGHGMNADIIENYWLKPGSSSKRNNTERTPKFKRLPLGEKGVGRLGVHRLGHNIQVISKTKQDKEVFFSLDWLQFEDKDHLSDIPPIRIEERYNPSEFKNGHTGTKLTIQSLKERFAEQDIATLNSDLLKLLSPFEGDKESAFRIELYTQDGLFSDKEELELTSVLEQAFFYYDISFKGEDITSFTYCCISPNKNMHPSRTINLSDEEVGQNIKIISDKYIENLEKEDRYQVNLGQIRFQGYIFETKLSRLFKNRLEKQTTEYLKENGGIRVYRDGIRVYNYGEGGKDNDILNLDRKRAKKLGDNIGYNQVLAAIELNYQSSSSLIEKTNREGFIHNKSFLYLQQKLDLCMDIVMHYRKLDKSEMSLLEGKTYDKGDIDSRINEITKQVDKLEIPDKEKTKLNNQLKNLSIESKQTKDIFLTAANTGLNLTFIVHELEKIINHLEQCIKEKNLTKVERVFAHLQNTVNAYKETIKLSKEKSISLSAIVKQSIFNSQYRFESHKITITNLNNELRINAKKGLIIGMICNLFDNSIYWLGHYKIKHKKIFIKTYSELDQNVILVADNGKGFNISFEAALGPFISGRLDDSSMGIGLHLASQVMEAHKGSITHGNWQEDQLPEEFANGAIIKLIFPKGESK